MDYEEVLCAPGRDVFLFLDPPYYSVAKSRLYGKRGELHLQFDHERLARVVQSCPHRWLLTYDDCAEVRKLYRDAFIVEWTLQYGMNNYKQSSARPGNELFIANDDIRPLHQRQLTLIPEK
jgi:DNA adenine methylase